MQRVGHWLSEGCISLASFFSAKLCPLGILEILAITLFGPEVKSPGSPLTYPIGSMYGMFSYIYHKNQPNVGKYTSPMDPMGTADGSETR